MKRWFVCTQSFILRKNISSDRMVMSRIIRHFSIFVVLSLLLHLGVFLYFATRGEETTTPEITPTPFFVDLREAEQKPRELDVPFQPESIPRKQPARRLAAVDQTAAREEAPEGKDSRDTTTVPVTQKPALKPEADNLEPTPQVSAGEIFLL
jgi:hypothetical protein